MDPRQWIRRAAGLGTAAALLSIPALALAAFTGPAARPLTAGRAAPAAADDDTVLAAWDETATAAATGQRLENSLKSAVSGLRRADAHAKHGSLTDTLLRQRIQVTQAELNALHRLNHLIATHRLSPAKAHLELSRFQNAETRLNRQLRLWQGWEAHVGHASPFRFSFNF